MAVLKSFELNGNKQSFASWISNLSPCDIPFVSMMKKERVDQAHYSWQVDSLAPAIHTGYVEGSNFDFPARKTVEVMQNYTSILRKVVVVSDTAERVATHGRDSEMKYQMGKAGKEIMRDLELMVLHRVNGNPSMKGVASRFAGFEGLTAGVGVKDADTGAVVHKSVQYAELISKEDLFDITYNLYLAGSKADKIMYHPKHAKSFSDLIGDNESEPKTYRMFDAMDTTANFQVKRIKDPLGRFYTLVPNRFMPEDKIFFYNEDDWTQTILRDPSVSKLGRKGSSERFLMEMEVGLRHRHPYASGILALVQINMQNHLEVSRDTFTAFVNDSLAVRSVITIDGVGAAGEVVSWHSTDEQVIGFRDSATLSIGSAGRASNLMIAGFQAGTARVWTRCRGVKSAETVITVRGAEVVATVDNDSPNIGDHINFTATVRKEDGKPLGSGIRVDWATYPATDLEWDGIQTETDGSGTAIGRARVLKDGPIAVRAFVAHSSSNVLAINGAVPVGKVVVTADPMTPKIGDVVNLSALVTDQNGVNVSDAVVEWYSDPQLTLDDSLTSSAGIATASFIYTSNSDYTIRASCETIRSNTIVIKELV